MRAVGRLQESLQGLEASCTSECNAGTSHLALVDFYQGCCELSIKALQAVLYLLLH